METKHNPTNKGRGGRGRRGNTRRRSESNVPSEVRGLVKERYGDTVKVIGARRSGDGYAVRVKGEPKGLSSSMFLDPSGDLFFDTTPPAVRKRELAAARRLEDKGYDRKAAEIRSRVAPELLVDEVAVRCAASSARVLAAVREVLAATGVRTTWHNVFGRGDEYGELSLDLGGARRIHAGSDADNNPWYRLDSGNTRGEVTSNLADIVSAI